MQGHLRLRSQNVYRRTAHAATLPFAGNLCILQFQWISGNTNQLQYFAKKNITFKLYLLDINNCFKTCLVCFTNRYKEWISTHTDLTFRMNKNTEQGMHFCQYIFHQRLLKTNCRKNTLRFLQGQESCFPGPVIKRGERYNSLVQIPCGSEYPLPFLNRAGQSKITNIDALVLDPINAAVVDQSQRIVFFPFFSERKSSRDTGRVASSQFKLLPCNNFKYCCQMRKIRNCLSFKGNFCSIATTKGCFSFPRQHLWLQQDLWKCHSFRSCRMLQFNLGIKVLIIYDYFFIAKIRQLLSLELQMCLNLLFTSRHFSRHHRPALAVDVTRQPIHLMHDFH